MTERLAVIAIGGNSLITNPTHPEIPHQWDAVRETCRHIATMVADGWQVVITHGNGPQVGFNLRRAEVAVEHGIHTLPLDLIVAHTQGSIGYMLQQALDNSLRRLGINRTIVTVVTQVRVDAADPAFEQPTKPIGMFMSREDAEQYQAEGWQTAEDAGRGWRRLVPSPAPQAIHEINAIKSLFKAGFIVIASGGGGVPVIRNEHGSLRGVAAVIDKDRASSLLAQDLRADLFMISTGVEKVALHFSTPQQRDLDQMTLAQADEYMQAGHFARGSMQPKIEAVTDFIRMGGPKALITNPPNLNRALLGKTGTTIIPG